METYHALRQTMANILDVQIKALFGEVEIPFNCHSKANSSLQGKDGNVLRSNIRNYGHISRDRFTPLPNIIIRLHAMIMKLLPFILQIITFVINL